MKKSILSLVVLSTISSSSFAATGLLTQDPNAPASNYDVIQDHAYQAAANMANSALTQNQQIVTQVNTVTAGVGANAQAIGVTNAAVGTANQNIQQNTSGIAANAQAIGQTNASLGQTNQTVQQNWNQQNKNNQVLAQQINKNAAQISGLVNQTGNFVTKPDYDAGQKTQDDALLKEQQTRLSSDQQLATRINDKVDKTTYDAGQAAQDKALNDETTARTNADSAEVTRVNGELAKKVDKTDYDAYTKAQNTKNQSFISKNNSQDSAIALKADQSALDKEIQDRIDGDTKITGLTSTNATNITTNTSSITANRTDINTNTTQIATNVTNINKINDNVIKEIADRKAGDDALGKRIDTKVETSVFTADQQRQDAMLNAEGVNRIQSDNAIIATADADRKAQVVRDTKQDTDIADRVTKSVFKDDQDRQDKLLSSKVDTNTYSQRASLVDSRFADTQQRIDENKADQQKVNKTMAGRIDNHETRISALENRSNANFANIDKRINEVSKKANAGTSTALAAAGIPQVMESQKFSIGAATGGYEGEQAIAVGFSARVSTNVVIKASIATDSQQGFGYNVGAAIGW